MDQLKTQVAELEKTWKRVHKALVSNPTAFQAADLGLSLFQLNDAVTTTAKWVGRVRPPRVIGARFGIAKALSGPAVARSLTAVQALERGEYNHLPDFVASIVTVLSVLHSLLVFSEDGDARKAITTVVEDLGQQEARLEGAQEQLGQLSEQITSLREQLASLSKVADRVPILRDEAQEAVNSIVESQNRATESLGDIDKHLESADELKQRHERALSETEELNAQATELTAAVEKLKENAHAQAELIKDLLPRGASAGLASAFGARARNLTMTKLGWAVGFLAGVGWLAFVAYRAVEGDPSSAQDLWQGVLQRLPLAAAPVWLAWFSAIQYGNTVRVQEDYAFKEATSKAFVGYRDHMEHMASVDLEEGNRAMTLLAAKTIDILANEPLRIFQGSHRDASPGGSVLDAITRRRRTKPDKHGAEE